MKPLPVLLLITQASAVSVGGAVQAEDLGKYRVACDSKQLTTINSALKKSESLLNRAINSLPPNNSDSDRKVRRWFGGTEGSFDPVVKSIYAEALGFLGFKTFWCPNASFPGDDPGTFAFVPRDGGPFGEVFLEAAFFKAPTKGADSQAGSIVHEVVHLSTKRVIKDFAYGVKNAAALATADLAKARSNADNFEYFAEDLSDGVP